VAAYVPQGIEQSASYSPLRVFQKFLSFFFAFFSHVFSLGAPDMGGYGFIYSDEVEMMMRRGEDKKSSLGDYVHDSVEFLPALSIWRVSRLRWLLSVPTLPLLWHQRGRGTVTRLLNTPGTNSFFP
jgi:hypothetical protein